MESIEYETWEEKLRFWEDKREILKIEKQYWEMKRGMLRSERDHIANKRAGLE